MLVPKQNGNLLIESIVQTLKAFKESSSNELVHFFLSYGDTGSLIGLKVTKKVIESIAKMSGRRSIALLLKKC